MKKYSLIFLLFGFGCDNNTESHKKKDTVVESVTVVKRDTVMSFDTTMYIYTLLSKDKTIQDRIESILFCNRIDCDDELDYVLADKKNDQFLCLTRTSLNKTKEISMIAIGKLSMLDIPCEIHYVNLPQLWSNDSISLGMTRADVINLIGSNYKLSSCDTCDYNTSLYYNYLERDYPVVVKKYNMPSYERQFWFDINDRLVKYRFGFPHP